MKKIVLAANLRPAQAVRFEAVRSGVYKTPEERALETALAAIDQLRWELDDPRMTRISLRKDRYAQDAWANDLDLAREMNRSRRSWKEHRLHQYK